MLTNPELAPVGDDDVGQDVSQRDDQQPSLDLPADAEGADIQPGSTVGASFESSFLAQTQNLARRKRKKRSLDPCFVAFDGSTDGF